MKYMINYLLSLVLIGLTSGTIAQSWNPQTSQTSKDLRTIFFVDDQNGWSMGKASGGNSNGNLRGTNSQGVPWNPLSLGQENAEINGSYFFNTQMGIGVGRHSPGDEHRLIIRTMDGGQSWTINLQGEESLNDVHFANNQDGWIVGEEGFIGHSNDGGNTWNQQSTSDDDDLFAVFALDGQTAVSVGEDGLVLLTQNAGQSWQKINVPSDEDLMGVFFANNSQGWIVGEHGTILQSINGGISWSQQTSGTGRDLHDIHMVDSQTGWIVGDNGTVRHTTDGGQSWNSQISNTNEDIYAVHMTSDSLGWFCGHNGIIHIYQPSSVSPPTSLMASFSTSPVGCAMSNLLFQDQSQGNIVSWNWNFGDGNIDTVQHPVHSYNSAGLYTAILIVTDSLGNSDTSQQTLNIFPPAPQSAILASDTTLCLGDTLALNSQSQGNVQMQQWLLGDGNLGSGATINHVYAQGGNYSVTLIATHSGICSDTASINITVSDPLVQISPGMAVVCGPTDSVALNATGGLFYQWSPTQDLSDSTGMTVLASPDSTTQYAVIGIDSLGCADTVSVIVALDTTSLPVASFNASDSISCGPLSVQFQNNSLFAQSFFWSFPGGQPSTSQDINPSVLYSQPGLFDVELIAQSCAGNDTLIMSGLIEVGPEVTAAFLASADTLILTIDSIVVFANNSLNATSWQWDFGNGDTSSQQNPSTTYQVAGNYSVQLIASAGFCSDTVLVPIVVLDSVPQMMLLSSTLNEQKILVAPNPFMESTSVRLPLTNQIPVKAAIWDLYGNQIRELTNLPSKIFSISRQGLL